jgi:hypothetical protein
MINGFSVTSIAVESRSSLLIVPVVFRRGTRQWSSDLVSSRRRQRRAEAEQRSETRHWVAAAVEAEDEFDGLASLDYACGIFDEDYLLDLPFSGFPQRCRPADCAGFEQPCLP